MLASKIHESLQNAVVIREIKGKHFIVNDSREFNSPESFRGERASVREVAKFASERASERASDREREREREHVARFR